MLPCCRRSFIRGKRERRRKVDLQLGTELAKKESREVFLLNVERADVLSLNAPDSGISVDEKQQSVSSKWAEAVGER